MGLKLQCEIQQCIDSVDFLLCDGQLAIGTNMRTSSIRTYEHTYS